MTSGIAAGRILVRAGTRLPSSSRPPDGVAADGWSLMASSRLAFAAEALASGMTFFFMAGGIQATAIGFDRRKTLAAAIGRLTRAVDTGKCNSIEIGKIEYRSFWGVPFVRVSAHERHLQTGSTFH
jgi:hypothetical protein